MSRLATRIQDPRVLKLIRRFLSCGVLIGGLQSPTVEGTPQGGPLSPLLSNIVLDELDQELEKRGLHFVRYADDGVIYVKSKRAGERVMQKVTRFVTRRLKLRVNEAKSGVTHPWWSKYLGFSRIRDPYVHVVWEGASVMGLPIPMAPHFYNPNANSIAPRTSSIFARPSVVMSIPSLAFDTVCR